MEDRLVEITDVEQNKEKRIKRIEDSLKELWDNFKCTNICILGVPEGGERDKGPEKILKATRERQKITYKGTPKGYQLILQHKLCRPEGCGSMYLR